VGKVLAALTLLLLAFTDPALAVIPEGGVNVNPIPEAPAAPSSLNAVIELLKRGDNAGALKGAREFVKIQPGSAAGHEVHGVAAQVNRLSREAEAAYTEALRLEPGRVPVMLRLGQLALEAREAKKAEGWFRKALAANPDLGAARRGLALSLLAQRQLGPALAEIQEALKRSDGRDMDAKYLLAQIMNDAGRPSAAEPVLDEVLAARPDHLPALLLQGLVKLELRKTDEAEALFARVAQRDPKSTQARLGLAIVERARGQLAPAATAIEGVIRDRPDWALAYLELGRTRLGLRQVDAALKAFDRAEQTSPDPAVMRVRAAQNLAAAGEIDRAIAKAQASLGSVNAAPLARTLLVRLYVEKGQPALAERELQASISAAPQEATPLLNLGRFYLAQRRPADAVAPLERAATLSPTLAEPLGMLVDAHIALGQKDQALAAGERLLRVQGETPAAYLVFGVVNEKLDRPAEALEAYQRALDKEPGHLAISRARASLLARQQRVPEAVRLLEDTADKNPKAPEPLMDLAQLEERTGNVPAAVAAYRRAVERAPENAILLNNLAYLLSTEPAARDEAVRLAERAQGLAPQSPVVADTLGWLLFLQGDLPRAEALLAAAAKAAPAIPEVRYHLGLVYAKQGKVPEARRELEASLKAGNFKDAAEARRTLESLP
jgi:tetratricopeptide (TPR) repeat protein